MKLPIPRQPIAAVVFLFIISSAVFAQQQSATDHSSSSRQVADKGKITGRVLDEKTAEPLVGVTIKAEGTHVGAKTNLEGKYTIQIDPGEYSLTVSYLGYEKKRIEGAVVTSGEIKKIDVLLKEQAISGEEVVVSAKIATETQTAQLVERKKAATMNDVLGAETIRRAPDATSADAVRRMPGVTISGNKFINIRGTNERYNNALLNGAALTSTEPDKKAFSFDLLPSNLLDNAIVTKTFTPDLPGNFSGGLVQLNTINFPEKSTLKLSFGSGYVANTTRRGFMTYQTGQKDWLAFDDGTRGIPSGVPDKSLLDATLTDSARQVIGRLFSNTWSTHTMLAAPVANFSASLGDAFPLFDNEVGFIASVSYKNGFDHSGLYLAKYHTDSSLAYQREGSRDVHTVSLSALANLSYRLSNTDLISLKNLFDRSADDQVYDMAGVDSEQDGTKQHFTGLHYTERSLFSTQLTGEHVIEPLGKLRVDWRASRSVTSRTEPDYRRYLYEFNSNFNKWYMALSSSDPNFGGRFFNELNEKNFEGAIDFSLPIVSSKVKFGGLLDSKTRDFWARSFEMVQKGSYTLTFLPIDSIFATGNIGPKGFQINETTTALDRYDAAEHVASTYAMVDVPFAIASQEFRVIGGARFEHDEQDVDGLTSSQKPISYSKLHDDVLPALSLIYSLNERMNLRAAWSNTVSRPEFREIAPFSYYDFETGVVVQGNPSIDRVLIRNLDLRYEYYPTAGELVSLSLFHKRFGLSHEFFGLLYPHYDGGAIEQTNDGSNKLMSWANASKPATNYGFEVELRKNFAFLTESLRALTLSGNYARIYSSVNVHDLSHGLVEERPMQGQAPYTVNVGLMYEERWTSGVASVLYNIYGRRITDVDYTDGDLYELPRPVLDASFTQPIGSFEVKYTARDILARDQVFERQGLTERRISRSPAHSLSIGYKF